MGSWRLHLADSLLEASDSCKANFGRSAAEGFTFEDRTNSIHVDDREHWRRSFDEAIENGGAFEVEYRAIWPDGSIHWISDRGRCYPGPSGDTATIAGITIDITDHKEIERRLTEGIAFNQRVIDSLASHIAVLDKDGVITAVNEAWRRFARENGADWTMKEVGVGVNYLNVCRSVDGDSLSDANQIYTGIKDVLDGAKELFTFEYPCHSPTQQRWFLLSVSPLGERGGAVVSHTNITERRLAETALRKSQERFDIVKDGAEIGFWFCDLPFDELEWDNRVKEHFWLPPDARVTIDTFYDRLHPEDRERTRQTIEKSIENKTYYDIDYRTVSPEGEVKWIRALGRGFYDDAGHPTRFDGVTLDVTQRRREQLALAAMKFQEAERLRIARDLHDHLGQQLTGLRLSIADLVASVGDDPIGEKVRRLQASALRLDKDVSSLAFEIRSNSLKDRSLAEALKDFVAEWSQNYGIHADFQLINSMTSISLPGEIEINIYRIAQEALNNATKHAKADSVGVLLEIRDSLVRLIVEDDGVGFDPTARRPDPERSSGGMGLVGMKERVELIHGELKIDSTPGEGTTIFVTAPI